MARPFRLFSHYDFFSVFVPGLATLMGFYMLLPKPITISIVGAIVPVLVFSFVFGQALHGFAAFLEGIMGKSEWSNSHRGHFAREISDPSLVGQQIVNQLKEECSLIFRDPSLLLDGTGEVTKQVWRDMYPTIQSYIYNNEVGRSRMFQSIFAFSRSMFVLLLGLPLLYKIHYYFRESGTIDRPPKYLLYFPNYADFMEVVIPLCLAGAVLFAYTAYSYKRYFVQYLISDFIALREQEKNP